MTKYYSSFLSLLLIISPYNGYSEEKAVKSENQDNSKQAPKPKNIDRTYGDQGSLNESKSALISVDPLELQNYSATSNNFDFSTYSKVTLKSVILETLSRSNDLKSANEKVIQTELEYKEAYSAYLPTIDFQYSVKKIHNLETGDESIDTPEHRDFNEENYKLTLRQSLYSGGATELKIKSLASKLEEAKRKYKIVLEQEIQKAIKAYFDVLFSYQSVIINERNMDKLNKILEITQIKYDSGALSVGDLSAVKANIANASGKLIKVKSDLADAIDFYLYAVGEDFLKTAPFEENFPIELTTIDDLYKDILENNLGLINYRLNIQSTKDKLLNMKATFKPKIDLELNYKNVLDKEEFTANEETYDAKITLNYNLFNGGKDTIATMKVFSSLQELNFRYEEEIKKIKWSVSKIFNSIKSLEETLVNTEKEVSASNEMVNSYWEGFQLGEQDLQVLLQGQRQLNGAELDLLKYKQDHLTNIFKLLSEKGELSKYFNIDSDKPDFIDFSNTSPIKPLIKLDLSDSTKNKEGNTTNQIVELNDKNETNTTKLEDFNTTSDEFLETVKEDTFEDILNFKDKFLEANDEDFTVMISEFTNHYDAYEFIKKNRLLDRAFSYEYFSKNGELISKKSKTKVVDVKSNIAYGIYTTVEEATQSIDTILEKQDKRYKVVQIKTIKELYNSYIKGLETQVEPYIVKPKITKTFMTNQAFKNKFLSAPPSYFTINVVSFSQINQAENLIKSENIEKDAFVFRYGRNGEWIKVMFGVFPTYEAATKELNSHPQMMTKYTPVIEKIVQKQALFEKYKDFNPIPEWFINEQKEGKEEAERKKIEEKKRKEQAEKEKNKISIDITEKGDDTLKFDLTSPTTSAVKNEIKGSLSSEDTLAQTLSKGEDSPKDYEKFVSKESEMLLKEEEIEPPEPLKLLEVTPQEQTLQNNTIEALFDSKPTEMQNQKEVYEEVEATPINSEDLDKVLPLKERFYQAPKGYYTIELANIPNNQKEDFFKKYTFDEEYITISKKGKTRIFLGTFETIEKARAKKFTLDPKLIDKVWLYRIDRIEK